MSYKSFIALLILGIITVCSGCSMLSPSTSTTASREVPRMEIWLHTVDSVEPVFEAEPVETDEAQADQVVSIGNGALEIADIVELIDDYQSFKSGNLTASEIILKGYNVVNNLAPDQREEVIQAALKLVNNQK